MVAPNRFTPHAPSAEDAKTAAEALRRLGFDAQSPAPVRLRGTGRNALPVDLPAPLIEIIRAALEALARGQAVTLVEVESTLTTQQAADVLGVSRPYLISMLEAGKLPFEMVGTHRRIRLGDLLAYQATMRDERSRVLDQLADESQRMMGDDY